MKRMLSLGRGSCVGGTTLSTTRLQGNKFWKYLIRKYSMQLLEPDLVPPHMETLFRNSELVTENHVSKRDFSEITCSNCKKAEGSGKHGHNRRMNVCPCKSEGESAPKTLKKERIRRKVCEKAAKDALVLVDTTNHGALD